MTAASLPLPSADSFSPIEPEGRVAFLSAACVALRAGPAACRNCVDACPAGSISFGDHGFSVSEGCLGCGKCAAVCASGALAVKGFENSVPPPGGTVVRVECWKVPEPLAGAHALRVPCLGGLAPDRWLEIAETAGTRRVVVVDRGWCAYCSAAADQTSSHPARPALERADAILAEAGWPTLCRPRFERDPLSLGLMPAAIPRERPESLARRAFFRRIGGEARRAAGLQAEAPLPRLLKRQGMAMPARDRLLAATGRLARASGRPVPAAAFVALTVASDCRHHGSCAAVCPTGALSHYEHGGLAGLEFNAWRCVGCGQCVRGCTEQAISLHPAPLAPDLDVPQCLTASTKTICGSCLQAFHGAPEEDTCPACRRNRSMGADLFGTLLAGTRA